MKSQSTVGKSNNAFIHSLREFICIVPLQGYYSEASQPQRDQINHLKLIEKSMRKGSRKVIPNRGANQIQRTFRQGMMQKRDNKNICLFRVFLGPMQGLFAFLRMLTRMNLYMHCTCVHDYLRVLKFS